ncbi:MAG: tetratricopeptide repeat protein [Balneolaceae bacterium]
MNLRSITLLFLTAGLLWSCSPMDPITREVKTHFENLNYEEAVAAADSALQENPANALAHYYRGVSYGMMASTIQPPADRIPYYQELRSSLEEARRYFESMEDEPPAEYNEIEGIIIEFWSAEHNIAAEIYLSDSLRAETPNPDEAIVSHLKNAITIEPDSALSYIVLSSILHQQGDTQSAMEYYEEAMPRLDPPQVEDYDYMIGSYFMHERFEDARDLSLEARELYPDEDLFIQYLADAYLRLDNADEAIALIRGLVESDPNNPRFQYILGSQIYHLADQEYLIPASTTFRQALSIMEQLDDLSGQEQADLQEHIDELLAKAEELEQQGEELSIEATEALNLSVELDGDMPEPWHVLGVIHQNRAASFFDKRNNTLDNDQAMEYDELGMEQLEHAREYYENAVELSPDRNNYWFALFQVYTGLGLDDLAEEALERSEQ